MIFTPLSIEGVWRVGLSPAFDERGFFARTFCAAEFAAQGLPAVFEQSSLSRNVRAGTLRGMHYQAAPNSEAKFVRCVRGAMVDVVIDIRSESPTYGQWIAETLAADNSIGLYIAPGLAHGFQTLVDNTDVLYQITPAFRTGFSAGVRWNDPAFGIAWPISDPILSDRDATYPDWLT
ncbi:dTDP-4-dehydrorhamnose 3,5-epimerase family protein [Sphingobium subterraneum]|uniref:dTDP-4-dehydrorhamnose 3,5-epimerase n=1 Tax=Sphingobium subterraneum TaxID=627688 RepID=A0A841J2J0_9SPHN|nr:dTDP-4-dehydrorhamnose 3,5-epimerase family protein [Sphingobium subterraneum]MBB6123746.1 dTDP-4-dehydrorhamnose 3,5-epimerase [Sphingobium subterraneum]